MNTTLGLTDSCSLAHPKHPSFDATDGYCREEAIMILRRFYVTENTNGTYSWISPFPIYLHLRTSSNPKIENESCTQNRYSIPRTNSPTRVIRCNLSHIYMPLSWNDFARNFYSCTSCVPLKPHSLGNKAPFIRSLLNPLNNVSIDHDPLGLKRLT